MYQIIKPLAQLGVIHHTITSDDNGILVEGHLRILSSTMYSQLCTIINSTVKSWKGSGEPLGLVGYLIIAKILE